jgi:ABC-type glutathione transport system ATPase component
LVPDRALVAVVSGNAPVVLLDEPVEHLDVATAGVLTADLLAGTAGRTTLLVTHRLAGLESVDEIVVLDAGRIVRRGTHDRLVAAGGPYRRMWRRERGFPASADQDPRKGHAGRRPVPPAVPACAPERSESKPLHSGSTWRRCCGPRCYGWPRRSFSASRRAFRVARIASCSSVSVRSSDTSAGSVG